VIEEDAKRIWIVGFFLFFAGFFIGRLSMVV